jgi:UDP-glucose 4-epimerase
MDYDCLEDLLGQVQSQGGALALGADGHFRAVVLNVERYNQLVRGTGVKPKLGAVLVTGGAGYIGAHTARELVRQGYRVVVVDNLSTGNRAFVPPEALFVQADIADQDVLTALMRDQQIETVMHFAASIEVEESVREPGQYFANNVLGTASLLASMAAAGVSQIMFSSTGAVYGEPTTVPIPETAALRPTSPYGSTKLLAEQVLRYYHDTLGFGVTIMRYFNVCGAAVEGDLGDTHINSHLIPIIIEAASGKRSRFVLNGNDYPTYDGTCVRDYVHVLDVAQAHVLALEKLQPKRFEVFNVGTGRGYSVEEMLTTAAEVLGKMFSIEVGPRRPGDPAVAVADTKKIRELLGFFPQHSDLPTIFQTTWQRLALEQQTADAIVPAPLPEA